MERRLKERLIGASVLLMLAVIFIPMILDNSTQTDTAITETNIPERPDNGFAAAAPPLEAPAVQPARKPSEPSPEASSRADEEPSSAPDTPEAPLPAPAGPSAASSASPGTVGVTSWVVQLGSFSSEENATSLNNRLRAAGFPSFVEPLKQADGVAYRVRIGPELLRSDAVDVLNRLKKDLDIDGIVLRYP